MADHDHIDLTTLEEVERLLATTDFATADDLVGRGGALPVTTSGARPAGQPLSAPPAGVSDSLPRRR